MSCNNNEQKFKSKAGNDTKLQLQYIKDTSGLVNEINGLLRLTTPSSIYAVTSIESAGDKKMLIVSITPELPARETNWVQNILQKIIKNTSRLDSAFDLRIEIVEEDEEILKHLKIKSGDEYSFELDVRKPTWLKEVRGNKSPMDQTEVVAYLSYPLMRRIPGLTYTYGLPVENSGGPISRAAADIFSMLDPFEAEYKIKSNNEKIIPLFDSLKQTYRFRDRAFRSYFRVLSSYF